MPLPTPKKGESQDDFISRCAGNDTMNKEFPDNDQRVAVCYSQWREAKESTVERKLPDDALKEFYQQDVSASAFIENMFNRAEDTPTENGEDSSSKNK